MSSGTARAPRRTDALSRERIIGAAIELLDADGESALTFRALAAALATGPGALYWHVKNKDELLAAATDQVVAGATGAPTPQAGPREEIRSIALALFDAIDAHPWVGAQLARQSWGLAGVRILESLGSRLTRLGVPQPAQFNTSTTLASYICGSAGQNAANAQLGPPDVDRVAALSAMADGWLALDADEFPFVRTIASELPHHDDREQFLAGVDLFLDGITASQAWGPQRDRPTRT